MPPITTSDPENPGGLRHTPALDGIRGLAIILVLICHLFWSNLNPGSRLLNFIGNLRAATWIGVNIFFVLSGFLITGILWETLHKPHFFRNFYMRRMLRIFPLYYGFMLFILALTPFLHLQWNGWQTYFLTYTAILVYWSRPAWNLGFFNINHFWTLQVEELFYLMWPLIVFRIRNKRRLVIVALLLCVAALSLRLAKTSLPYTQFPFLYLLNSPIISRADDLLFGCILALLFRTSYRAKILANAARVFTVCFTLLIALGLSRHGFETTDKIVGTVGITLLDIAACSLVAMTFVAKSKTKRLFENSVLRQFGHYSYGLYVYHFSLAGLMLPRMRPFLNAHLHSKALSVVAAGLVVGLVSYGVALISYNLYEVRFLHFKKYFSYQSPKALQPLPLDQQPAS